HGLKRFDAGAQGEHKLLRGFEPVTTHSLHYIQHPEFRGAIDRFLDEEREHIEQFNEDAKRWLPYKNVSHS
ncbi:peptidogalycan biosysnthesis protein, partial [Oleiphilus sp. HI0125]